MVPEPDLLTECRVVAAGEDYTPVFLGVDHF